jgi:hypothetical protein
MMTKDQAEAILLAERVLQLNDGPADGPDYVKGTAWHGYVTEAASVVSDDRLLKSLCNGLHILEDDDE